MPPVQVRRGSAGLGLLEQGHDSAVLATFFNSLFKEGIPPLGRAVIIRNCRARYTMIRNSTHDSTHSCRLQLPNPRLEPGTLSTYGARGELSKQGDPRYFRGVSKVAKKVILHIGFHKTGSSALQVFLASNADRLAAAGIGYPYPDPEHIVATGGCSGNAFQVLQRGGFWRAIGDDIKSCLTKAYFEKLVDVIDEVPQRTTILSSEVLSVASRENLTHFVEMLRPFHDMEIVCFVRDPFDMVLSCWLQMIKNESQTFYFSSYMDKVIDGTNSPSMLNSFALFHNLGLPLTVLNFDHHRHNIAVPFLRAIGAENLIDQVEMTTTREANRSLTPSQAHLGVLLHEKLNNKDLTATFLRAVQIRDKPRAAGYYNRDQHQRILDRFASAISLINQYLPDDQKLATQVRNQPDANDVRLILIT